MEAKLAIALKYLREYWTMESKLRKLSTREAYNRRLARKRVVIEHINAKIKTFKSMAYPYQNHCRRHLLRISLICCIINLEAGL